jgi:ketosteroid isomerase-like protein
MTHPNAQRYLDMMQGDNPDFSAAATWLADDVVWFEAGNPEPFVGRDAVLARLSQFPREEGNTNELETVLADDDNLVVVGQAHFEGAGGPLDYRYVEHYLLSNGVVTERRSYMDAVPADVADFFR